MFATESTEHTETTEGKSKLNLSVRLTIESVSCCANFIGALFVGPAFTPGRQSRVTSAEPGSPGFSLRRTTTARSLVNEAQCDQLSPFTRCQRRSSQRTPI